MFSESLVQQLAAELQQAEQTRVQVAHFSRRFPGMTIGDGYAVSRAWVAMKLAAGRVTRGHKIGLTSRAMQQASQITEPDYGTLLDDMFIPQGSDIPASRFIAPRVEVELAFVLGRRLQGPNVSIFDVLDATDYVVPAIEIIDGRRHLPCRLRATGRYCVPVRVSRRPGLQQRHYLRQPCTLPPTSSSRH